MELTGPAIPCLFMGTEFFNAAPFAATPAAIDWSFLADATHAQTRLLYLTRALIAVRLELQLHAGQAAGTLVGRRARSAVLRGGKPRRDAARRD